MWKWAEIERQAVRRIGRPASHAERHEFAVAREIIVTGYVESSRSAYLVEPGKGRCPGLLAYERRYIAPADHRFF